MKWIRAVGCEGGNCVEVAFDGNLVAIRNSQIPGEIVWVTPAEWQAFVDGAKAGEFTVAE